jgi:C4-dicarboxylate-specific signal transduction histidine kinase
MQLAHVARVTTLGELAASIAHEVNQPLAAIIANGYASVRWLAAKPPNLAEAHGAVERVIADANRASEVISGIRAFLTRGNSHPTQFQVEDIIGDVMVLLRDEAFRSGVSLLDESAVDVPSVVADRVQIKQVILNLVMNAIEAMRAITGRARDLAVGVQPHAPDAIVVSVRDSGVGLDPRHRERVFEAFFTTKPEGIGMGLAISRSIVNAHGGRLWSTPNKRFGETFPFTLPAVGASSA